MSSADKTAQAACDQDFLFSCVAAVLAASRDHDLTISCLEEAFARCENGKALKSSRVSNTIERILQTIADPTARDVDTMRTFFVNAGLGFQESTRCAQLSVKKSIPSPMKLALLVARQGSNCLEFLSLSEEDESLILLAIRTKYTSPVRRRGMSSVLYPQGNEAIQAEEDIDDLSDDEFSGHGSSVSGMKAEQSDSRSVSPSTPMPRSRTSSHISEHDLPLAPSYLSSPPEVTSMPLSAICSALRAQLSLHADLSTADTITEACFKLSVKKQNNLKLDAAAAYCACMNLSSPSAGKGRIRAVSDWVGEANTSPSTLPTKASKTTGTRSRSNSAFAPIETDAELYDYDGGIDLQRSVSPSGPIHVPAMVASSDNLANGPGSSERDRHKTLSHILPTTSLPALTQPPLISPPQRIDSRNEGDVQALFTRSSSVSRRRSFESASSSGSRRHSADSSLGRGALSAAISAAQDSEDEDSEESGDENTEEDSEDDEEEDSEDDEEEEEDEKEEAEPVDLPDVSNMSITQLCLTLREKLGLQGGIGETVDGACKKLGIARGGNLKADASKAVVIALTPQKTILSPSPRPRSTSGKMHLSSKKSVQKQTPSQGVRPGQVAPSALKSTPTQNKTINSTMDVSMSTWSPESVSSRQANFNLTRGDTPSIMRSMYGTPAGDRSIGGSEMTLLDATAIAPPFSPSASAPLSDTTIATSVSLDTVSAMSLTQLVAELRTRLNISGTEGMKESITQACLRLNVKMTGNLKCDAAAAFIATSSTIPHSVASASRSITFGSSGILPVSSRASVAEKGQGLSVIAQSGMMTPAKRVSVAFAPPIEESSDEESSDEESSEDDEEEEENKTVVAKSSKITTPPLTKDELLRRQQEAAAMSVTQLVTSLRTLLGLSSEIGMTETVSTACSTLGVTKSGHLKNDATLAFISSPARPVKPVFM